MKIGFDISQTGQLKAGCGYFADSLVRHLAEIDSENTYILYPTFGDAYWDPDWPTATCQINQPNFARGLGHRTYEAAQLFWSNPPTDAEAQLGNPDIIHANNFFCPPGLQKARLVYTLYDLGFLEHPEWTTEQNRIICFTGAFNASLHADRIIAISDYSRRHFLEIFPHYPSDRVVVIYPASRFSGRSEFAQPEGLPPVQPEHFWLNVGTLEPRKNHRRLLQAYARLKSHLGQTYPLVLAGGRGWLMDDLEKSLDSLDLRQNVIMLGYVDDATLQWLYQNCFALVYPSLFEGFGLPVLEAMSLGAAVITSNVSAIPEIVGSAGVMIDPTAEEGIFRAMLQLIEQENWRTSLRQAALAQATLFSWDRTARKVLDVYAQVLSDKKYDTIPVPEATPVA